MKKFIILTLLICPLINAAGDGPKKPFVVMGRWPETPLLPKNQDEIFKHQRQVLVESDFIDNMDTIFMPDYHDRWWPGWIRLWAYNKYVTRETQPFGRLHYAAVVLQPGLFVENYQKWHIHKSCPRFAAIKENLKKEASQDRSIQKQFHTSLAATTMVAAVTGYFVCNRDHNNSWSAIIGGTTAFAASLGASVYCYGRYRHSKENAYEKALAHKRIVEEKEAEEFNNLSPEQVTAYNQIISRHYKDNGDSAFDRLDICQ